MHFKKYGLKLLKEKELLKICSVWIQLNLGHFTNKWSKYYLNLIVYYWKYKIVAFEDVYKGSDAENKSEEIMKHILF